MGRATRWLKSLLGMKKQQEKDKTQKGIENQRKDKPTVAASDRRWSFTKPGGKEDRERSTWNRDYIMETEQEQSKHAIAVAAATAAAADAAVAAAQAAVAVVRLTSQGRGALFVSGRERWAAVKIQTHFKGFLARKALRALKGLVKLQAHVRGFLVRKRAAATLHSMQALIRAQAMARSQRAKKSLNTNHKRNPDFRARRSIERIDETRSEFHSKRLSASFEPANNAYEGSPKIVEIDTYYKTRSRSRRIIPSMYDFANEDFQYPTISSPLPCPGVARFSTPECQKGYHNECDWGFYTDECKVSTAHNTPRFNNMTHFNGHSTPTKSVCGDSFFRPYSNHPNYMADTQSYRAKLRSQSAPKQRPDARPKKKLSLEEIMAARNSISGIRMHRSSSQVHDTLNFLKPLPL